MTIEELRIKLKSILTHPYDPEEAHSQAEDLLLEYINDPEVKNLWYEAEFWYA